MSDVEGDEGARLLAPVDGAQLRREMGLLSEEELAAILDVKVETLRNWRVKRQGRPWIKAGSILYRRATVMTWLEEQERRSPVG